MPRPATPNGASSRRKEFLAFRCPRDISTTLRLRSQEEQRSLSNTIVWLLTQQLRDHATK